MIRVLIVDDHRVIRDGYRALMHRANDIQIVDEARDGLEAIEKVHLFNPDVVLMDYQMPCMDGLHATRLLKAQDRCTRVVMVSMSTDVSVLERVMQAGAMGLVSKSDAFEELLRAIRAVSEGTRYFSATMSKLLGELQPSTYHSVDEGHMESVSSRALSQHLPGGDLCAVTPPSPNSAPGAASKSRRRQRPVASPEEMC